MPADPALTTLNLGPLAEFELDGARRVDVDGHRLAVVRLSPVAGSGDEEIYVIGDRCSHADYSLAEGELDRGDKTLECWKHGSAFSLETGEPTCLPATKPVPTYTVRVVDGTVLVDVESPEEGN